MSNPKKDLLAECERIFQSHNMDFWECALHFASTGFFFANTEFIVLASSYDTNKRQLNDSIGVKLIEPIDKSDGLYIFFYIGDIRKAMDYIPDCFTEVTFNRLHRREDKSYNLKTFKGKINNGKLIRRREST